MSDLEPEDLPHDVRALLDDEARRSEPSPERVDRIRRGVLRALESSPPVVAAPAASRGPLWFVSGAVLGAIAVALLWSVSPPRTIVMTQTVIVQLDASGPTYSAEHDGAAPAPESSSDAAALPLGERRDGGVNRPRAERIEPAQDPDLALRAERELIETAQSALARHAWADASHACAEHLRRFARAQLVEEREAVWVQALAGEGRTAEAWARAESFRRRFPSSLLRAVVERAVSDRPRAE